MIESCPDEWKVNADFPEIPGTLVESKAWTVVCSRPFKTAEAMHMKEARAINWCLRRSSKNVHTHNSRRLVLCDNMSVVLSFERKRAHVYPLLRQVRLMSALSLASGTFYSLRWIPSELNPSDLPSRRFEKWSKSYQTGQWLSDLIDESREQYARHVLFDSDSGDWIYCRDFSSAQVFGDSGKRKLFSQHERHSESQNFAPEPGLSRHCRPEGESAPQATDTGERAREAPNSSPPQDSSRSGETGEQVGSLSPRGTSTGWWSPGSLSSRGAEAHCEGRSLHGDGEERVRRERGGGPVQADSRGEAEAHRLVEEEAPGLNSGWRGRTGRSVLPRAGKRGRGRAGAVQSLPARLFEGFPARSPGEGDGQCSGSVYGGVYERPLLGGPRRKHWRQVDSSLDLPVPGVRSPRLSAPSESDPGSEGMASALSGEESFASAMDSSGDDLRGDDETWRASDGLLDDAQFLVLPSTVGVHATPEEGLGAASRWSVKALEPGDCPIGSRHPHDQSGGAGRFSDVGLPRCAVVLGDASGAEGQREHRESLEFRLLELGAGLAERLPGSSLDSLRAVSIASRRTFPRPAAAVPELGGDPEARTLEAASLGGPIRKGRQSGTGGNEIVAPPAPPRQAHSNTAAGGPQRPPAATRAPRRRSAVKHKPLRFLDAFGGVGGVTAECQKYGVHGVVYDIAVDKNNDFRNRAFVRSICRLVRRRHFCSGMFHTPCTTFCIARDRNSQIRTRDFPMGLPAEFLSEKQAQQVKDGNETMFATVRLVREFDRLKLPWAIENPLSSRLWLTAGIKSLMNGEHVQFIKLHMCQFGSKWKKPTGILCGNMPSHMLDDLHRLCSCQGSICSRTHKPHLQLTGTAPCGKPWTAVAQVYPKQLCVSLAKLLVHQVVPRL